MRVIRPEGSCIFCRQLRAVNSRKRRNVWNIALRRSHTVENGLSIVRVGTLESCDSQSQKAAGLSLGVVSPRRHSAPQRIFLDQHPGRALGQLEQIVFYGLQLERAVFGRRQLPRSPMRRSHALIVTQSATTFSRGAWELPALRFRESILRRAPLAPLRQRQSANASILVVAEDLRGLCTSTPPFE